MQESVPFSIVDDGKSKPMVAFQQNGEEERRYPEQVSSYILEHLKKLTQMFAGFDIKDVVITVPARYTQIQRQIVRDAASIAGLNAADIIPEPVAAAYAYADVMNIGDATVKEEKNVLIYDLGGGTFDVTIMKINGMEFTELALGGDPLLGGSDFDRLIRDDLIRTYEEDAEDEYGELSKRDIDKLLKKCEDAKIDLRVLMETEIVVNDDIDWTYNLTRGHMNDLIGGKIDESIRLCDEAIARAGLNVEDIDTIVLVGGSTRLCIVKEKLKEHFPQLTVLETVNPDECVAAGAAKYAYALSRGTGVPVVHDVPNPPEVPNPPPDEMPNPPLREVPNPPLPGVPIPPLPGVPNPPPIEVPHTVMVKSICPSNIGIQGSEGEMIMLINAGDELPCRKTQTVSNTVDYVERIPIRVYQGNDPMCANNTKLKQVTLTINHPGKEGENVFEISCSLDQMGNLTLGVKDANKNGPEKEIRNFQATPQKDGYWFYNVGGINSFAEFAYRIVSGMESRIHLIQNGKYMSYSSARKWRNTDYDPLMKPQSLPYKAPSNGYNAIYYIHVPSFTQEGSYAAIEPYVSYLRQLGIISVEFMNLEPQVCASSSSIHPSCWYHSSVVFPGIPHPAHGSQSSLSSLLRQIAFIGMSSLYDVDISSFSAQSDWYSYDGSANATWFGTLFDPSAPLYDYEGSRCGKPQLALGHVTRSLLTTMLQRPVEEFGFSGLWWRGVLCLRLKDEQCAKGKGGDDLTAVRFVQNVVRTVGTVYGEDTCGVVEVENPQSVVRDVTASSQQNGLGFAGALNLSIGERLLGFTLQRVIPAEAVVEYLSAFASIRDKTVLSLDTTTKRLVNRCLPLYTEHAAAVKHALLIHSFFLLTPGIPRLLMGDEYLTEQEFAELPSTLDLDSVGVFSGDGWKSEGPRFGLFNYTRDLLAFRLRYSLFAFYSPSVYYANNETHTIAFVLRNSNQRIVGIANLGDTAHHAIEEIDFPPLTSSFKWSCSINTDRRAVYSEFEDVDSAIEIGACHEGNHYKFKDCANVTLDAHSFRIYESVYHPSS
ncbi:BiP [Blastocystis sp. ATCC 50177/Nand II]|uniref:BiP n=1 Tax=Blastocystis sp. subtype 1 (strain ATCC 50177 / NandII) TaxID=478820 RepID=A0A196S6M4_BLAHN|nr:BiP [Blastocystis sp. ATCC 50177/Nand II]